MQSPQKPGLTQPHTDTAQTETRQVLLGGMPKGVDPFLDKPAARATFATSASVLSRLICTNLVAGSIFMRRPGKVVVFILYCVTFAVGAPLAEFMLWKSTIASAAVLDDAYEKTQLQHIRELREKV